MQCEKQLENTYNLDVWVSHLCVNTTHDHIDRQKVENLKKKFLSNIYWSSLLESYFSIHAICLPQVAKELKNYT